MSYDFVPAEVKKARRTYEFFKGNPDQQRDDHGRFGSGSGGGVQGHSAPYKRRVPEVTPPGGMLVGGLVGTARAASQGKSVLRGGGKGALVGLGIAAASRFANMAMARAKDDSAVMKRGKAYTQAQRDAAEAKGHTMPGGGFPIANTADLARAKRAFGRAKNKPAARRWINARAKALGASPLGGDIGKRNARGEAWDGGARRLFDAPKALDTAVAKFRATIESLTEIEKSAAGGILKDGIAYGWASVIEKDGKVVTDHQGDRVNEEELLKAAHDYVTNCRVGGVMHIYADDEHQKPLQAGHVVESLVFTKDLQKALGIDLNKTGWLVGYQITDPHVKQMAAAGVLKSFSIGGSGVRSKAED